LLRESLNDNDPHVRAGVAEALREMAILSRYERGIGPPPGILIVDQKDLAASAPRLAAAL